MARNGLAGTLIWQKWRDRLRSRPLVPYHGAMSEWLKEHAWKACVGETLPWVRIPLSPPSTLHHIDRKNPGWLCETRAVFWRQWPLDGADTRRLISKGCQLRDVRISRAASW